MLPILLDIDPGIDDAIALLMALSSPDVALLGVTTVGGNARLAHTTRNALRILEYAGRHDIPVARGASRPLRGAFSYAYHFHGPGGLTARLPLPVAKPITLSATQFLGSTLREAPGRVTLVALGPLTNIAHLLQQDPQARGLIGELLVMGGAFTGPGNAGPLGSAEFNIYNDPEAAQVVLSAGIPTTVVGLDVCHQVAFQSPDELLHLINGGPEARLAGRLLANWFRLHPGGTCHLCDPLALAAAIQPKLLTCRVTSVTVETHDDQRRGETRFGGAGPAVRVATGVDVEGFFSLLDGLLAGAAKSSPHRVDRSSR